MFREFIKRVKYLATKKWGSPRPDQLARLNGGMLRLQGIIPVHCYGRYAWDRAYTFALCLTSVCIALDFLANIFHDVPMMKLRAKFYFVISGEINIVIHKNWLENGFAISDISLFPVRCKREY